MVQIVLQSQSVHMIVGQVYVLVFSLLHAVEITQLVRAILLITVLGIIRHIHVPETITQVFVQEYIERHVHEAPIVLVSHMLIVQVKLDVHSLQVSISLSQQKAVIHHHSTQDTKYIIRVQQQQSLCLPIQTNLLLEQQQ